MQAPEQGCSVCSCCVWARWMCTDRALAAATGRAEQARDAALSHNQVCHDKRTLT